MSKDSQHCFLRLFASPSLPRLLNYSVVSYASEVPAMKANKFERQNRYAEKLKAEGLKRFQFWMKPEEKDYLMQILQNLREGNAIEIKSNEPVNTSKINELIRNGHFFIENNSIKSKPYFHDLLNSPERFWHNPLPDAMIVVADRLLRTKQWRAVYLKGLGAFPVVWSIIFALTRYVDGDMALKHPKRRNINLLEYDFELLIKSIVGRAAMRAEDDWRGTIIGFITYQVRVESQFVSSNIANEYPKGVLTVVVDHYGKLKATNAHCDNIQQITAWRIAPPVMTDTDRQKGWNPYMLALAELFKE